MLREQHPEQRAGAGAVARLRVLHAQPGGGRRRIRCGRAGAGRSVGGIAGVQRRGLDHGSRRFAPASQGHGAAGAGRQGGGLRLPDRLPRYPDRL
ncbi:hypothetical protein G6F50_016762 [Rhizopus delemar]|uniref:Uncharacterized protein n=1 Tax=Rhizopus delemar TaxID=936053 RepID=A0A9P6XT13_9FUNG|nr:hypothetical protein G6F50_016762 [Rhizopus delemar]